MFQHGSSCLAGPVSETNDWWRSRRRTSKPRRKKQPDSPIRRELVERIRREIAAGRYDTAERLEKALMRLIRRYQRP